MEFAREALIKGFDPSKISKEAMGHLFSESLEMGVNALSVLNSPPVKQMMTDAGKQVIHLAFIVRCRGVCAFRGFWGLRPWYPPGW